MAKVEKPSPVGKGTYAELDGDNIFTGPIEVGGDYSKLILNNNLADNADDEFGIRFIGEALQVKLGEATIPVQAVGINADLAAIYGTQTNPISSVFGETLSDPVVICDPVPEVYPFTPIKECGGGWFIIGNGYKHQGAAVDIDALGYYFADIISGTIGTKWKVYSDGYVFDEFITGSSQNNKVTIPHAGVTGVLQIELSGRIDCSGSSKTSGAGSTTSTVILACVDVGAVPRGVVSVGWDSKVLNPLNYIVVIDGVEIDTLVPILSGPISYNILATYINAASVDYSVSINSGVPIVGTAVAQFDWNLATSFTQQLKTQTVDAAVGVASMKNYGSLTTYLTA